MNKELNVFLTAVMFFTRIPCPKTIEYSQKILNESARYYPLIGWIVGGVTGLVFYGLNVLFPPSVAVLGSMIAGILLTGAFHEDGFADTCDGFGGGADKQKVLAIMKDSRIGTYGAIGLAAMLAMKFLALNAMSPRVIPLILVAGHSLSRFISSLFRFTHSYARDNDDSKVKPMAKELSLKNLAISAVFGLLPMFLMNMPAVLILIIPVVAVEFIFSHYVVSRIGGYTGDCLGAAQQLCEVTFYLSFLVFMNTMTFWL